MNNSTKLQTGLLTEENKTGPFVVLIILILALCLHAAVQWCIYRAQLHTNNYYLIRTLSLADFLTTIWILFFGFLDKLDVSLKLTVLSIILSSFLQTSFSMPLVITMLIVTDRWIGNSVPFTILRHRH